VTDNEIAMTLVEHLEELRRRLIVIVLSVLGAAVVGFLLSREVIALLRDRLPEEYRNLIFLGPADALTSQLKVAGFLGIAFAMPIILFEIWRFVSPGLTQREKRFVWPVVVAGLFLFVTGVLIGYVVIPYTLNFLLDFSEGIATHRLRDHHDAGLRADPGVPDRAHRPVAGGHPELPSSGQSAPLGDPGDRAVRDHPHPRRRPDLAAHPVVGDVHPVRGVAADHPAARALTA
jgi:hypothetical protein